MSTQHVQWLFAVSTMEPYHYDLSLTDFKLETSTFCDHTPTQKDKQCISNSRYKCTEAAKRLRKRARRKRKGLDDRHQEREGPMYILGGFDSGEPGPSKRLCTRANN